MSFYTSLTGLNAATAMLGVTSNNISNVGTTGFKRSRADFGDIFATSPLQKASSTVGQGVSLKQCRKSLARVIFLSRLTRWTWPLRVTVSSHCDRPMACKNSSHVTARSC